MTGLLTGRRLRKMYDSQFYETNRTGARESARRVLPLINDWLSPTSVLDVGCGSGDWLAEWRRLGAEVVGVEGHHVDRRTLAIDDGEIRTADLAGGLRLGRTFDLVMSLEVAEHLPRSRAPSFVDDLLAHGDCVLFSAAIPSRGVLGVNHINEQWQSYWVGLFEERGARLFDVLRPRIWDDPAVSWYYRQDLLLFARRESARKLEVAEGSSFPLDVAHPGMIDTILASLPTGPRQAARWTLREAWGTGRRGLSRICRLR